MHHVSSASIKKGQKRKCQILNASNETIDYLLLRLGLLSLRKVLDCVKGRWNHKVNLTHLPGISIFLKDGKENVKLAG